jgi:hypothetical protein
MTFEDPDRIPVNSNSASSDKETQPNPAGTRVEQCEFESLLRRAMEILDSRTRRLRNPSS